MAGLHPVFDSLSLFCADSRSAIHATGRSQLSGLREQIEREGYGWLDGYMDTLMNQASGSKTPYVNLLKTPSRTQTAKKTRANDALMTERAQKIASVNAKLNGSPLSKSNSSRMPLSPLGPRSLNATSMSILGAPPSGKKGRTVKVHVDSGAESPSRSTSTRAGTASPSRSSSSRSVRAKPKGQKALEKPQAIREDEEKGDDDEVDAGKGKVTLANSLSSNGAEKARVNEVIKVSKKRKTPSPEPDAPSAESVFTKKMIGEPRLSATGPSKRKSDSPLMAGDDEEPRTAANEEQVGVELNGAYTTAIPLEVPEVITTSATETNLAEIITPTDADPILTGKTRSEASVAVVPAVGDDVSSPAPAPTAQPARQVRSSWLSKALGGAAALSSGQNPSSRGSAGSRPSVANPRQTLHDNRKSIAQPAAAVALGTGPSGLKRKSDAAGLDDEAHSGRDSKGDKASKVERQTIHPGDVDLPMSFANPPAKNRASVAPSAGNNVVNSVTAVEKPTLDRQKSHEIFGRATLSSHTSKAVFAAQTAGSATPATTSSAIDTEVSESSRNDKEKQSDRSRGKSDIHAVSKKVDEMRERQLAKEALRQKAALSASNGASSGATQAQAPPAQAQATAPSSGGFLRGLGSTLGRSLGLGGGASAKQAEENAQKLARELKETQEEEERRKKEDEEAERRAEEELREIMGEVDVAAPDTASVAIGTAVEMATPQTKREEVEEHNVDVDMDEAAPVSAKSPEQVEEEDEAEVFEAVQPTASPNKLLWPSLPTTASADRDEMDVDELPAHAKPRPIAQTQAPTTARQPFQLIRPTPPAESAVIAAPMHSPNRPRASPPRPTAVTTGIPLPSPTRGRLQQMQAQSSMSTTPQGTPSKFVGTASARFAPAAASSAAPRMYPSLSKTPVAKPSLHERIKLFEPLVQAQAPPQLKQDHAGGEERMAANADIASEGSDSEAEGVDITMDVDEDAGADTADEIESEETDDEDVEMDESIEEIEPAQIQSPIRRIPEPAESRQSQIPQPAPTKTIILKQPASSRPPVARVESKDRDGMAAANANRHEAGSRIHASTSTTVSGGISASASASTLSLSSAAIHANKTLGIKPTVGPIKSLQAKKNLGVSERRAQIAEERRKAAAERKIEEDRRMKEAEERKKQLERDQQDRRRKEIEARRKAALKEKEEREERERVEAEKAARVAAAQAQAEHERKRKLAAANAQLAKSASVQPLGAKRIVSSSSTQNLGPPSKMKEPIRLTKPTGPAASASSSGVAGSKMGPTSFRTVPEPNRAQGPHASMAHTNGGVAQAASRPPTMLAHQQQAVRSSHLQGQAGAGTHPLTATNVLAASRLTLQKQLDAHAAAVASEDIVLPDIASEYSDSDDSDQGSPAFKRPEWAESPQLKELLRQQAMRDPDELFGPVQPLNMEELFKAPKNKFRHRTSSANWSRDGLTKGEEEEYARRMGFTSSSNAVNGDGFQNGLGMPGSSQPTLVGSQRSSVHGSSGLGR